ncbi:MAG: hypothetical protein ABSB59_27015 [Streptosporangiaceae bacterium]|jgi:hypothetical protein
MQRLVPDEVRSRVAGARMTISSLGFPLGTVVGGTVVGGTVVGSTVTGGIGVPGTVLAVACSGLALGLLPLLAPPLRAVGDVRAFPGLAKT